MEKKDLIEHSPVRYFDSVTNGGLKNGEMGLVTAKKGLGKTSVLVQFGIDSLLKDKAVVHVSFDQHSSNVISWYSSILSEIGKKKHFSDIASLNEEIVRERTILNFNQENFTLPKVVNTIKALKDGGIKVCTVVVDGLDFSKVEKKDIEVFASFVKENSMIAIFSYTNEADTLKDTLEEGKLDFFASVSHLASDGSSLVLSVLKNDGAPAEGKITLDAKTLLMSK